jgi:uncharacterized RDD family membrane protein YckC
MNVPPEPDRREPAPPPVTPPWEPPATPAGEPTPYEPYGAGPYGPPWGVTYGGRWRRLIAAVIDGLIVYAVTWIVTAPVLGFGTIYEGSAARRTGANLIAAAVAVLYYVLQHGRWGQTVGKRTMSLRVVRAEDAGRIGYGQAALRLIFAYVISAITCGIGGLIDVAWILWDSRRQALHDKVARTVVVTAEPGAPNPYEGP